PSSTSGLAIGKQLSGSSISCRFDVASAAGGGRRTGILQPTATMPPTTSRANGRKKVRGIWQLRPQKSAATDMYIHPLPAYSPLASAKYLFRSANTRGVAMPFKKGVPEGMRNLSPHIYCRGAAKALEFYKKAFGAVEISRAPVPGNESKLMH